VAARRTEPRTSYRKAEHLRICLSDDVSGPETTGLEEYAFVHQALPELDREAIDPGTALFGKHLKAPLVISGMTGGTPEAAAINRRLAEAAQRLGVAMGVGSQRAMLEDPALAPTFQVRDVAPDILLFANLGAVQLNYGYGPDECRRAVEAIGADALALHLNPLQEALQPEGNTNFSLLLEKIEDVCRELEVPVIVKEVGAGISGETAAGLAAAGVSGIDTAGTGGTSWSRVEGLRGGEAAAARAAALAGWGIPTAASIRLVRENAPGLTLIASGGIRTGLDVAKCLALGADAAGLGLPLLKKAAESTEAVVAALADVIDVLRTVMFCTGAGAIEDLQRTPCTRRERR
jgi:isopentenyl-diphosphate delta-isomerase